MTVIVANHTPPSVRGMLKRWFIEPSPNVFVGTLNARIHSKTLEYIQRNAHLLRKDGDQEMSMLIISSFPNCQTYTITTIGSPARSTSEISGLLLVSTRIPM